MQCLALRVTHAHDWRQHRLAPEVWLLCERDLGTTPRTKYYLVNLPVTASLKAIVRVAHHRWAIEQQYQELKTELGLDHFEGRTFPGWHHHVVLTAITYNFLQAERRAATDRAHVPHRARHREGRPENAPRESTGERPLSPRCLSPKCAVQDPHRPMQFDTGRPRAVIRLRISQPRTAALPCPAGLRARRPSPMMDL